MISRRNVSVSIEKNALRSSLQRAFICVKAQHFKMWRVLMYLYCLGPTQITACLQPSTSSPMPFDPTLMAGVGEEKIIFPSNLLGSPAGAL